jgi:hypothetical protein
MNVVSLSRILDAKMLAIGTHRRRCNYKDTFLTLSSQPYRMEVMGHDYYDMSCRQAKDSNQCSTFTNA